MAREFHSLKCVWSNQIWALFDEIEHENYSRATKRVFGKIAHFEWVPPQMVACSRDSNGSKIAWETRSDQAPYASGGIHLLPIDQIYQDWKGIVYFDYPESDPAQQRLETFKIVDFFVSEACVGLYHDAQQDPELFLYSFEGLPQPLGVDVKGYMQLLTLSLGYYYWQQLLVELTVAPTTTSFSPKGTTAQRFVQEMSLLSPDFTLEAFIQLYEKVRLRR
jgi:hypothetical protein